MVKRERYQLVGANRSGFCNALDNESGGSIYKVNNIWQFYYIYFEVVEKQEWNFECPNVFDASNQRRARKERTRGSERRGTASRTLRIIGTRESVSERYHFLYV